MNKANSREYRTKLDYSITKKLHENYLLNPFIWSAIAIASGAAFWLNREYNALDPINSYLNEMAL